MTDASRATWPTRTEHCSQCGHELDTVTGLDRHAPSPGNVSICIACLHVTIFDAKLRRQEPTPVEARQVQADQRLQRVLRSLAKSNLKA